MVQKNNLAYLNIYSFGIQWGEIVNTNSENVGVLIDKDANKYKTINKIVFVTDFSENSFTIYLKLLELLKKKKCIINFLYVGSNQKGGLFTTNFKAALQRFTKICPATNIGIIWETSERNIITGLNEVVDQFGGDLIVLTCNFIKASMDYFTINRSNFLNLDFDLPKSKSTI